MISEEVLEQAAMGWFESVGYETRTGAHVSPGDPLAMRDSYESVLLVPRLMAALRRINPTVSEGVLEQVVLVLSRPPEYNLVQNNRWFHQLLVDGIDVEYHTEDGETRLGKAWLVDFDDVTRNEFMIVRQMAVTNGRQGIRPDLIAFVNGMPIAVIELKDPAGVDADVWTAFDQLQRYKATIPLLFAYNELMVISDGDSTRVGSLTSGTDRFSPWRSIEDDREPGRPNLENLVTGLFDPGQLLEYIVHCVTFEDNERSGKVVKKLAGYHQFRAVRRARERIRAALKPAGDGRGGVIWHTQGSGKSLTMLMLAASLIGDMHFSNPTVVVVTDRNDLDGQLFATFADGQALLRQPPEQAESRARLAAMLNRASGGVIFTTIQKFEHRLEPISERFNIIVLADEAHRSQYNFYEGGARWMREALPNATFVGFTGTPLERDDRNTPAVFGAYVDTYDVRQAVDDHATVPIYYEMRLIKLLPDEEGIEAAQLFIEGVAKADDEGRSTPADIDVPLRELVGAKPRLQVLAREIIENFERRREAIEGKGLIVCMSREICIDLYEEIVALRPAWHAEDDDAGFVKVVISGSASEGQRFAQHARTKARREKIASRFVDPDSDLRLVIVCDMWLTGFDCPPMHTMYLDKPLAGHNLMQAIARVNRVFGEKPGGIIVDYLGIADELRSAVQTYTQAGGEGAPIEYIQSEAVPVMLREYEALLGFFDGFDLSLFSEGGESQRIRAVTGGVDFVLGQENGRQRFTNLVEALSKAFSLAVPRPEADFVRDNLIFFQSIRAAIRRRLSDAGGLPSDSRTAVRQVISGAILTGGVIDLFEAAGLPAANVGILSDDFLDRLSGLPQKNIALETLRKLLNDEIRGRERINIVQSRGFRDSLEDVLRRYTNRAITTAEVVSELIDLARLMRDKIAQGQESGLTEEEIAFYDALADNRSAKEVMRNEALRDIARELSARIRAKVSLDWTERESVRADMRRTVRRILARSGYPPDAQEAATQLVIRQAEMMAEAAIG